MSTHKENRLAVCTHHWAEVGGGWPAHIWPSITAIYSYRYAWSVGFTNAANVSLQRWEQHHHQVYGSFRSMRIINPLTVGAGRTLPGCKRHKSSRASAVAGACMDSCLLLVLHVCSVCLIFSHLHFSSSRQCRSVCRFYFSDATLVITGSEGVNFQFV